MAKSFRVVALISAFNEGDIISPVIGHLVENGVDVYLLDNHSTDDTVAQAEPWLGRGLLKIESFPGGDGARRDRFEWSAILRRKEALSRELEADWFIHHDADEVREGPWPGVTLSESIRWVDRLGYNAIDFRVLTFRPVDDGFRRGLDPRSYFTYYEPGADYDRLQIKCWKARPEPVSLYQGGHEVRFADRRVFPMQFLLRHYPVRGQEHGRRKVFEERRPRFTDEEKRVKGWHVQYDDIGESHCFLGDADKLSLFDADQVRLQLMLENESSPRLQALRAELAETLRERTAAADRGVAENDAHRTEREALATELDRRTAEREVLATQLDGRTAEREALAKQLAERTVEKETLATRLREMIGERDEIAERLRQTTVARDELDRRLGAKRAEQQATQAERQQLAVEADSLRQRCQGLAEKLREQATERGRLEKSLLQLFESANGNGALGSSPNGSSNGAVPPYGPDAEHDTRAYQTWLWRDPVVAADERRRLVTALAQAASLPRISVVIPVYRPELSLLERAIESVRAQIHPGWQVCICDDGSNDEGVTRWLDGLRADPRFRIATHASNRGISAALNTALGLADGEFVAFLDQDDEIHAEALAEVALVAGRDPQADLIYTDEDKIDENGERCEPFFKPDWSPETLLSQMYVGHLVVARRSLAERLGGFRTGFDGSQDYDFVLRASEIARSIAHVPKPLYHWRKTDGSTAQRYSAKPWADRAARAALQSALVRRGEHGEVVDGLVEATFRVRRRIRRNLLVSVIIPFRDGADLLQRCLDSLRERAGYDNWEALLVDNQSWQPETAAFLRTLGSDPRLRVLQDPAPFNFSAVNNRAVRQARGEILLFLNSDIEGGSDGWLAAMVEHGERPAVGAVGARLLYPSGHVQHAGIAMGIGGIAGHPFRFCPPGANGYFAGARITRNCSGVTGACMLVRRSVFDEVGGFDESLRVAFNDVDFCLRLRELGYQIVCTPFAELVHHESISRGFATDRAESTTMLQRWGERLSIDPYFNPNFSRRREDCALPVTPEEPPWKELRSRFGI